eukprot:CAMPEP_0197053630 /NCGR_PEP_ID=MMETSP1384-20130603/27860_1 /TAXON_ID=29189 /ORGANISM="Ammonia sp." /LENGTH=384 /DNA_ID=CAMNT_0042486561 /DNA_START=108 /DNA_END=1262 /DNA_ORIENTATION=-
MSLDTTHNRGAQSPDRGANWSWFSVWRTESSTAPRSRTGSYQTETDFEEIIHSELQSTDLASLHSLESNLQINDQYVDINDDEKDKHEQQINQPTPAQSDEPINNAQAADIDDDDEAASRNDADEQQRDTDREADENEEADKAANDAVMISQTLTLRSRNEELERERDELQSETLQLRMQTECLRQTNDHIIAAQQQEIVNLRYENEEALKAMRAKEEALKAAQQEISRLQRERDELKRKLHEICYSRLNASTVRVQSKSSTDDTLEEQEVLISNKHSIYGCIHCGQHLFDSSAMIQRQIEIDDNTFGCLVDCLFSNGDTTMGPTVCKTFLNGMFKVKEIFCDGCLATFGWKIIESFDEWNTFHQNKYVIDIANIKQITNKTTN